MSSARDAVAIRRASFEPNAGCAAAEPGVSRRENAAKNRGVVQSG
jgi:hypothetical protein